MFVLLISWSYISRSFFCLCSRAILIHMDMGTHMETTLNIIVTVPLRQLRPMLTLRICSSMKTLNQVIAIVIAIVMHHKSLPPHLLYISPQRFAARTMIIAMATATAIRMGTIMAMSTNMSMVMNTSTVRFHGMLSRRSPHQHIIHKNYRETPRQCLLRRLPHVSTRAQCRYRFPAPAVILDLHLLPPPIILMDMGTSTAGTAGIDTHVRQASRLYPHPLAFSLQTHLAQPHLGLLEARLPCRHSHLVMSLGEMHTSRLIMITPMVGPMYQTYTTTAMHMDTAVTMRVIVTICAECFCTLWPLVYLKFSIFQFACKELIISILLF